MKRRLLTAGLVLAFPAMMAGAADVLTVQADKVGVNTGATDPAAPLEVIATPTTIGFGNAVVLLKNAGPVAFQLDDTTADPGIFWNFAVANGETEFRLSKAGTGKVEFAVDSSGNVRIPGSFISNGTSLDVPDFVFAPSYDLMPLAELGSFIERERHLPNVPSAKEVHRSGLNMTDMQMRLLQKIEELTLYTLEQEKRIEHLEALLEATNH